MTVDTGVTVLLIINLISVLTYSAEVVRSLEKLLEKSEADHSDDDEGVGHLEVKGHTEVTGHTEICSSGHTQVAIATEGTVERVTKNSEGRRRKSKREERSCRKRGECGSSSSKDKAKQTAQAPTKKIQTRMSSLCQP